MSFSISEAWAEGAPAAAPQGDGMSFLIMTVGMVALFYFMLIRPQSKRHKLHKEMISSLQKGDEVVTTGGLLGKIINTSDNFISLEINNNVVIHVQKNAIQSVMPKGTIKEQQKS